MLGATTGMACQSATASGDRRAAMAEPDGEVPALLAEARALAGCDDFGDLAFLEP